MTNSDPVTRLNAALEGRYEIERELGEGGMATVYLADDIRHERKVALKVLKPELAATIGPDRFLQEVRVTANLQHPHILPLFDSGEAGGFLFYVMPFVDGESVRERLAREGELPVTEALMILREVVDALSAAHRWGVVHRDIKPDNVMLTGRHAVVTDFGVAKAVSEGASLRNLPTAGVALGTPVYMAPEQAASNDDVDHRADIYAAGAMGYELLTGRPPFSGRTAEQLLAAHVAELPRDVAEVRASVPTGVAALIMRCLEKKPADRWQTAEELLAQLDTFATGAAGVTPARTPPMRPGLTVPMWLKVAAPGSLIALAGLVWFGGLGSFGEGAETESSTSSSAAIDEIISHERLIVMPLENLTGEPEDDIWSMLAAEWIGNAIDRPRPIDVIPAAAVRDALTALGDSGSVSAVANRVAASHAIAGTLARTGDQVRFQIELLDARTGERLRTLDPVVGSVDAVEATVGRLADDAAVAAVVLLSPRTSIESPIRSMPPSIDAYRQVVLTGDLFCQGRYREAIEAGDRARELAPDLVSPLFLVRIAYVQLGLVEESDSVTALLQTMRDRMTNVERLIQEHRIHSSAGDLDMVTRTGEELFRMVPTTVLGGFQAGEIAVRRRRTTEAVDRFLMVDTDAPCAREWRPLWSGLADAYHLLGRYEEELSLVRRGLERFPEDPPLMDKEARALAAMDQEGRVDSLLVAMDELPPRSGYDPNVSAVLAGLELRAHGHHEAARRTLETAANRYATLPPGQYRQNRGRAYQHAGRWEDADTTFTALAAEEPESWAVIADHGLILATMGRVAEAKALSRRLAEFDVHPTRRGEVIGRRVAIAAALGEQDDAIALLQEAFAAGYMYGTQFHTDPAYVAMRDNPQWAALVAPG